MTKIEFNPQFGSVISPANNCICDACHATGKVIKLVLPETKYIKGKILGTKHTPYWLCRKCRDKLVKALEWKETADG